MWLLNHSQNRFKIKHYLTSVWIKVFLLRFYEVMGVFAYKRIIVLAYPELRLLSYFTFDGGMV